MTEDQESHVIKEMVAAISKLQPTVHHELVVCMAQGLLDGYRVALWESRPGDDSKWSDMEITPAMGRALVGIALNR